MLGAILLAGDDREQREALQSIFDDGGFAVTSVGTGSEAIAAIEQAIDGKTRMPDALVLDVCMPDYSGMGLLAAMRAISLDMPVIVITDATDDGAMDMATSLGAFRVLRRPLAHDALRAAAREAISTRNRC